MGWYAFDLAPVGPDIFAGWTPHGSYFVQPSHGRGGFVAVFTDRRKRQTLLGRFDTARDAKIAAQTHAAVHRRAA